MESKSHFFMAMYILPSILLLAACTGFPVSIPGSSPTPIQKQTTAAITKPPSLPPTAAPTSTPTFIPPLTSTSTPAMTPTHPPLTPVQVTEGCHGCASPQIVIDAQGTLHLFWRWAGGDANVGYAQIKTGGQWEKQELRLNDDSWYVFSTNYRLLHNPLGQACLTAFGHNYQTSEPALLVRCYDGTHWLDTQKLSTGNCDSTLSTCDFAFAPDGQLRVLDGKQIPGQDVQAFSFIIDQNGSYHALLYAGVDTPSVLYRFSADNGQSWSPAQKLADEYSMPELQPDTQGNLYYWTRTSYRRWSSTQGWQDPVDVLRYGIQEIKRLVPAADGRLRILSGKGVASSGIYYSEQLSDEEWSMPIQVSQNGINADLVIDMNGVAHIAFDEWGQIYYMTIR